MNDAYINLVTFRKDGSAVETPVWFAKMDGRLYVFTDGLSYKVKRLRKDPRIRIAPCNVVGKITGSWTSGRGRIVEESDLERRAYAALRNKYGWQMALLDLLSRLSGRIKRRVILELTVEDGLDRRARP